MSTAEDVAPVALVLEQVTGDPDAVRGIAARWRGTGGGTGDHTAAVMGAVNRVDAAWEGSSADAFAGYMRPFGEAGEAMALMLAQCADQLDGAAQALQDARTAVQAEYDLAVAGVTDYRAANPDLEEGELRKGIAGIVEGHRVTAQGHADTASTAITAAATEIGRLAKGLTPTFGAVKPPDEQQFAPRGARTWIPVRQGDHGPGGGNGGDGGPGTGGAGGFGGYGSSGPPPGSGVPAPEAQVREWIKQALTIAGLPADEANIERVWTVIYHESGGNPNAINLWDSNAAKGIPSKGLMQTIDPTFQSYSLPGHKDIWNPVDNIIAGVRYAIDRYGSLEALVAPRRDKWFGY